MLINNTLILIIDQFGNYVIQSVLALKNINHCNKIVDLVIDNIAYYSKHKYSSNVIEKCFDCCDELHRKKLIDALSKNEIVNDLILDEHGNYVIQKVLNYADNKIQEEMLKNLCNNIEKIKTIGFGERIINRLMVNYPQMTGFLNKNNNSNFVKNNNNKYLNTNNLYNNNFNGFENNVNNYIINYNSNKKGGKFKNSKNYKGKKNKNKNFNENNKNIDNDNNFNKKEN